MGLFSLTFPKEMLSEYHKIIKTAPPIGAQLGLMVGLAIMLDIRNFHKRALSHLEIVVCPIFGILFGSFLIGPAMRMLDPHDHIFNESLVKNFFYLIMAMGLLKFIDYMPDNDPWGNKGKSGEKKKPMYRPV